jgi:hypothetical protein
MLAWGYSLINLSGCRFKHVMTRDLETLESIGLSDIPQWYREQENLPSLRPGPPTSAGLPKGSWRKASTPPKAIAQHNEEIQDNGTCSPLSLLRHLC